MREKNTKGDIGKRKIILMTKISAILKMSRKRRKESKDVQKHKKSYIEGFSKCMCLSLNIIREKFQGL